MKRNNLWYLLEGSDIRSIGKSNEVVKMIHHQQDFDLLMSGFNSERREVVMRVADVVEKVTIDHPEYLVPHKAVLLRFLFHPGKHKEFHWHLVLIVSRLPLKGNEREKVMEVLKENAVNINESKIVRVNSLQALTDLSSASSKGNEMLLHLFDHLMLENIPSMNARIRKLKKQITRSSNSEN